MAFFDQIVSKIFGDKKSDLIVEDHSLLKRSDSFDSQYKEWLSSERKNEIITQVRTSIALKQKDLDQEPYVSLLDTLGSKGFAISYSSFFQDKEFSFLLDLFAESILEKFNYKKANADFRMAEKGSKVESIERRYLKPKTDFSTPIDQQFGNILIENRLEDNKPKSLKMQVNAYQDRNYQNPRDYQELIESLFK